MKKETKQTFVLLVVIVVVLVGLPVIIQWWQARFGSTLPEGRRLSSLEVEGWLNGKPTPQQLAGKVLVVYGWASW